MAGAVAHFSDIVVRKTRLGEGAVSLIEIQRGAGLMRGTLGGVWWQRDGYVVVVCGLVGVGADADFRTTQSGAVHVRNRRAGLDQCMRGTDGPGQT